MNCAIELYLWFRKSGKKKGRKSQVVGGEIRSKAHILKAKHILFNYRNRTFTIFIFRDIQLPNGLLAIYLNQSKNHRFSKRKNLS